MEEEWRPVVGFEGVYEVSDFGNVRSLPRSVTRSDGLVLNFLGKNKKPTVMKSGHLRVGLQFNLSQKTNQLVHRLVAEAFLGPQPEGKEFVLHWDDDPGNNHVENLRWGTKKDNRNDAVRNGKWRSHNSEKTHCVRGHEFTEENTYRSGTSPNRQCRECRKLHDRKRRGNRVG